MTFLPWVSPAFAGNYFIIRNQSDSIVIIEIDSDFRGCDILLGELAGNVATAQMIPGTGEDHLLKVKIVFYSDSTASGMFLTCSGDCPEYPADTPWALNKIY